MGILSCLAPWLTADKAATSHSSVYSDSTLVGSVRAEKAEAKELEVERHAVTVHADSLLTGADKARLRSRLLALRAELEDYKLDAYVVPTADAHQSEWVAPCDQRRHWLTGFTGSAGTALVTRTSAHLFVDTRYWVQASKQVDPESWTVEKVGKKDVKSWAEWVLTLDEGSRIGIDAALLDYQTGKSLSEATRQHNLDLVFPAENLVDRIWEDRPARTHEPIRVHPLEFTGKDAADKLADLRAWLAQQTFTASSPREDPSAKLAPGPYYLLSSLNPIAWFLNLRGSDIAYDPVFYAYVLVSPASFTVWLQAESVGDEVREAVERVGGEVRAYGEAMREIPERVQEKGGVLVTDGTVSWAVVDRVGQDRVKIVKSPVEAAQAIKNCEEIEGFRKAYLRDGAAWACWQAWLEEQMDRGREVTEWDAAEELTKSRAPLENFAGLAYENISATGQNAALPHYQPSPARPTPISLSSPYLNDSGAQYLDGTIDTTRTMHFGRPTRGQMRAFTRVLQGHIAVDVAVFPEGSTGDQLDTLARAPLWRDGMNYGHGTGHGVGEYLSVHESQVGIAHSASYFGSPLAPGHITSNEPGFYEEGSFGIRLESVLVVQEVQTRRQFGDRRWLGFERLTTVPIQTRMIDWKLLSAEEKAWVKEHNRTCARKLLPLVKGKGDKRAEQWLKKYL